ncbi:hypothetical protein ACJX0J_015084, partial [Zea mays]
RHEGNGPAPPERDVAYMFFSLIFMSDKNDMFGNDNIINVRYQIRTQCSLFDDILEAVPDFSSLVIPECLCIILSVHIIIFEQNSEL